MKQCWRVVNGEADIKFLLRHANTALFFFFLHWWASLVLLSSLQKLNICYTCDVDITCSILTFQLVNPRATRLRLRIISLDINLHARETKRMFRPYLRGESQLQPQQKPVLAMDPFRVESCAMRTLQTTNYKLQNVILFVHTPTNMCKRPLRTTHTHTHTSHVPPKCHMRLLLFIACNSQFK